MRRLLKVWIVLLVFITAFTIDINANSKSQEYSYKVDNEYPKTDEQFKNRIETPYWFPNDLLNYQPEQDKNLEFYKSNVKLVKRVDNKNLVKSKKTQDVNTKVMAISIMNPSTSGNLPQGTNSINTYTFTQWQYVDELVYWGGSAGEGIIVPPTSDVIDIAHKNGVKVFGTVFFPQDQAGGKLEWLNQFLMKKNGRYLLADKLIEVANTYGFDGWFINQETANELSKKHAKELQSFMKYYKQQSKKLNIVYYDSMTKDGKVDWQNGLTEQNRMFLQDRHQKVADSMFLNFWWSDIDEVNLLKQSAVNAKKWGINPYDLYAGIDVQANGYNTKVDWSKFEKNNDTNYTSLGLYCPSWTFYSSNTLDEFLNKEQLFWNGNSNWPGISKYVVEKTILNKVPFSTNFNIGSGKNYFINGKRISNRDWSNRSVADVLPTYQFKLSGNNQLSANYDFDDAYYGGNSLKLSGESFRNKSTFIDLFSANLKIKNKIKVDLVVKANEISSIDLVVTLNNGKTVVLKNTCKVNQDWSNLDFDLSRLKGKTIEKIALKITPKTSAKNYQFNLGRFSINKNNNYSKVKASNLVIKDSSFDDDGIYAAINLDWQAKGNALYYQIFQETEDHQLSFIGVSNDTHYFIEGLKRENKGIKSNIVVIPVIKNLKQCDPIKAELIWPDNSKPKADFISNKSIAKPNESIKLTAKCSLNTETIDWEVLGANIINKDTNSIEISYPKEGLYDVKVIAKNESGEASKEIKGFIKVTNDKEEILLSKDKNTTASGYTNENERPALSVDGNVKTKWCATGTPPHYITIDLQEMRTISNVKIYHASAGGESESMNTKEYKILVSDDGKNYKEVSYIKNNKDGVTNDVFKATNARYVKIEIIKPTQNSDNAVRLYEIEVYGNKKLL